MKGVWLYVLALSLVGTNAKPLEGPPIPEECLKFIPDIVYLLPDTQDSKTSPLEQLRFLDNPL